MSLQSDHSFEGVLMNIAINKYCPRSGKPVVADSLTTYRGVTVGFCNPHCRDDFAANVDERPNDTRYFDALIKELDHEGEKINEKHIFDRDVRRARFLDRV